MQFWEEFCDAGVNCTSHCSKHCCDTSRAIWGCTDYICMEFSYQYVIQHLVFSLNIFEPLSWIHSASQLVLAATVMAKESLAGERPECTLTFSYTFCSIGTWSSCRRYSCRMCCCNQTIRDCTRNFSFSC